MLVYCHFTLPKKWNILKFWTFLSNGEMKLKLGWNFRILKKHDVFAEKIWQTFMNLEKLYFENEIFIPEKFIFSKAANRYHLEKKILLFEYIFQIEKYFDWILLHVALKVFSPILVIFWKINVLLYFLRALGILMKE